MSERCTQQPCVGARVPASLGGIRHVRTEPRNLFTHFSHAESQFHRVHGQSAHMDGRAASDVLRAGTFTEHQLLHLLLNGRERDASF